MLKKKTNNKYRAIPVFVNGNRCDSKKEGMHYAKLLMLEKAGNIKELRFHPIYKLHALGGELIGKCELDFDFYDNELQKMRFIDVKGVYTAYSKWKHKHCEKQHGIKIELWR